MANDLAEFKTTRDDFKLFKRTFMEWVDRFGLKDWDVSFRWEEDENKTRVAAVSWVIPGKNATVFLSKSWPFRDTGRDIERAATHEFSHLLIADMECLAKRRCVSDTEIEVTRESLARRFENAFYPVKHI